MWWPTREAHAPPGGRGHGCQRFDEAGRDHEQLCSPRPHRCRTGHRARVAARAADSARGRGRRRRPPRDPGGERDPAPVLLALVLTIAVAPLRGVAVRRGAPDWLATV